MTRKLFALLLTHCAIILLHAQQPKPQFGIRAGFNFSMFSIAKLDLPIIKTRNDNGGYAGVFLDLPFNNRLGIQPEVYYVESRVQNYAGDGYRSTEILRQIAIPVLARLNSGHAAFYAGPQLSILTAARYDHFVFGDPNETPVTENSYARTLFSAAIGLSYTFKYRFGIDLRYQLGLSNARASNGVTALTEVKEQDIKINGVQAGLYFKFGKRLNSKSKH